MDNDFVSVHIDYLKAESTVDFDLFLNTPKGKVLYREKHLRITLKDLERLRENKLEVLYVNSCDKENYHSYLKSTGKWEDIEKSIKNVEEICFDINDPQKVSHYYELRQSYFPIKPQLILKGTTPPFTIYEVKELKLVAVYPKEDQEPRPLEKKDITALSGYLVVQTEEMKKYHEYIQTTTKEILKRNEHPLMKAMAIKESSKAVAMELMQNPRSKEVLNEVKNEVENLMKTIGKDMGLINSMVRLGENDYYTFTHSVNVSLLCFGIGKSMGLKEFQLYDLAIGGFLHDIGKSEIKRKILNKPGALTDSEFVSMRQHVTLGIEIFKLHGDLPKDAYYPLAMHHERLSGNGYPSGLKGEEINIFGRISAIADFYDALTTPRSYQNAKGPFEALQLMEQSRFKTELDQEALKALILVLGGKVQ